MTVSNSLVVSPASSESEGQSTAEQLNLWKTVALPGALGGLAKTTMDLTTSRATMTYIGQTMDLPRLERISEVLWLSPANMFLGAVSALIGTLVLSDLLDFQRSTRKIFGLSLIFGLSFSLVFEAATSKFSVEQQLSQVESARVQAETVAVRAATLDNRDELAKRTLMQNVRALAETSSSPQVQTMAVESMVHIADQSTDVQTQISAMGCLGRLAAASPFSTVQHDAVLAIRNLATQQPGVQPAALEQLQALEGQLSPEVQAALGAAIAALSPAS